MRSAWLILVTLGTSGNAWATDYFGGDYGGAPLALVDGDTVSGVLSNVGRVTVSGNVDVVDWVEISATALEVRGVLNGDGMGFSGGGRVEDVSDGIAGDGPGAGEGGGPGPCVHGGGGGGGSHHGVGGTGGYYFSGTERSGGPAYSDPGTWDGADQGSGGGGGGGGCSHTGWEGGAGGAAIRIEASTIVVSGAITANGARGIDNAGGSGGAGGGGAGGSIQLVGTVSGLGEVTAHGGDGGAATGGLAGGGGGGGGGVVYVIGDTGSVSKAASGGAAGANSGFSGGSVYSTAGGEGTAIGEAGAETTLTIGGECPGVATFTIEGAPGGRFLLLAGARLGSTVVPAGACAGLEVGIESPTSLRKFGPFEDRDGDGVLVLEPAVPGDVCGMSFATVELRSCSASEPASF